MSERPPHPDSSLASSSGTDPASPGLRAAKGVLGLPEQAALFQASPVGIAFGRDRVNLDVNDRLCEITGYRRDELVGQPSRAVYVSDAAYLAAGEALYSGLGGRGRARTQTQIRRKDGQIIDVALHLAALNPDDVEAGVVVSVTDTTDARRTETLLEARAEISEAVDRGDREAVLAAALRAALQVTRSVTSLFQLPEADSSAPWLEALGVLGADGEVAVSLASAADGASSDARAHAAIGAAPDERPPARCRRRSRAAVRARAAAGLSDAGAETNTRELAVPLPRDHGAVAVLTVADKAAPYLDDEVDLLRQLASMAADALDALRAGADLRAREARAELVSDLLNIVIWDWDICKERVSFNRAGLRMLGMGAKPLLSDFECSFADFWERVHPDDRDRVAAETEAAMASDAPAQAEYRLRTPEGNSRIILSRGRVLERDAQGRPLRVIGADIDITELRRTQADLEDARARLELAVEGGDLGLYEVDIVNDQGVVDDRYLRQIGLSRSDGEFTFDRLYTLLHPDDQEKIARVLADLHTGRYEQVEVEYRLRHADGGWRWILDRGRIYERDAAGRVLRMAGVHLDITARKATEEALAELNRTLEGRVAEQTADLRRQTQQLRALAGELHRTEQRERKRLATILHDHIQQLMVAAQIQVKCLLSVRDAAEIPAAAQGIADVLAQALEASRSLTVELSPPLLRESGLIVALNWLGARTGERQGLAVSLCADPAAEPADEDMRLLLFECARELLLNVAKHANCAQVEMSLLRPEATEIRLIVSDAGSGFDPAVLQGRRPEEMTFGLFSIRERLGYLGGRMEIESAPGRGTQVTLVVPIAAPAATAAAGAAAGAITASGAPAASALAMTVSQRATRCRVLLVDDHPIVRSGLAGLLQIEPDMELVGEAADGEQAVAKAAELRPDVIVMDINLGDGIDGVEATRRVLATTPGIRVIGRMALT